MVLASGSISACFIRPMVGLEIAQMSNSSNSPGDLGRGAAIDRVIDEALRRGRPGDPLSDADVGQSHPDRLPELSVGLAPPGLIAAARQRVLPRPASSTPKPFPADAASAERSVLEEMEADYE